MNFKYLILALSLSLLNWALINFLIQEINVLEYLLIESLITVSRIIYEYEKRKIQSKKT